MLSRRQFSSRAITACLLSLSVLPGCGENSGSPGERYLRELVAVLKKITSRESDAIKDIANSCADTIIERNRCFLHSEYKSLINFMNSPASGLPPVFVTINSPAMADTIREGDVLVTTHTGTVPATARTNGARLAGISTPAVADDYAKKHIGKYADKTLLSHLAPTVIRSNLPVHDGLVSLPDQEFQALPGSAPALIAIVAALSGEVYARSGGIGLTGSNPPSTALDFIEASVLRLAMLENTIDSLRKAAAIAAETLSAGGTVFVYDQTGVLNGAISDRAGVPQFLRPVTRGELTGGILKSVDTLIVAALSSNGVSDMSIVKSARKTTGSVLSFCPRDNTGGYRIFKDSAVSIDNHSHETDGLFSFDYGSKQFLKTAHIVNAALLWMLSGEISAALIKQGHPLRFYRGKQFIDSVQSTS